MSIPESIASPLYEAFAEGDADAADTLAQEALQAGVDPLEIINTIMIPALTEVGELFQSGEYFLPELMLSGQAAEVASKHLEAAIEASGQLSQKLGVVVLGTVEGDVHDIGKNIVATMLRAHGFAVVDLGRNVSPSAFVDTAQERNADVVGLSSLMTTTRPAAQSTINLFNELGLSDTYSLMVGGGSVTSDWAVEMGVGYSPDAAGAVELCKQLVGLTPN
jgi:5-methyltetrahydrofolate--homocysteine methyltransferase